MHNFKIEFIPVENAIKYIEDNLSKNEMNRVIAPDMIIAIKEYLNHK